jgi:hypothetical protein
MIGFPTTQSEETAMGDKQGMGNKGQGQQDKQASNLGQGQQSGSQQSGRQQGSQQSGMNQGSQQSGLNQGGQQSGRQDNQQSGRQGSQQSGQQGSQQRGQHASGGTPALDDLDQKGESAKDASQAWSQDSGNQRDKR